MGNAPGGPLRVEVLGPVRAWLGDRELNLGPPLQRAVLALLALRAGRVASGGELIDGLWGEHPPRSAANGVHTYIKGLRRALEPGRSPRAPGQLLTSAIGGYLLRLEPGRLDVTLFGDHLRRSRHLRTAGDLAGSAASIDAALRLWQASPLCGIPGPLADIERTRLGELRLTAVEEHTDIVLAGGRPADAVPLLLGLIAEHPLRERFRAQLMTAYHRCGRPADALAVYRQARQALAGELGIEPGPDLRELHQRILRGDRGTAAAGRRTGQRPAVGHRPGHPSVDPAGPGQAPSGPAGLPPAW